MSRRHHNRPTEADVLARYLADAYLSAWCRLNPTHDAPGWREVSGLARAGFLAVAQELLRRGVRPPASYQPLPVEWVRETKEEEPA